MAKQSTLIGMGTPRPEGPGAKIMPTLKREIWGNDIQTSKSINPLTKSVKDLIVENIAPFVGAWKTRNLLKID